MSSSFNRNKNLTRPKNKSRLKKNQYKQITLNDYPENTSLLVTQIRSSIGRTASQRAALVSLGLGRKLNKSVVRKSCSSILGMINKVGFMLKVEKTNES